jgi:hypothetical protein
MIACDSRCWLEGGKAGSTMFLAVTHSSAPGMPQHPREKMGWRRWSQRGRTLSDEISISRFVASFFFGPLRETVTNCEHCFYAMPCHHIAHTCRWPDPISVTMRVCSFPSVVFCSGAGRSAQPLVDASGYMRSQRTIFRVGGGQASEIEMAGHK